MKIDRVVFGSDRFELDTNRVVKGDADDSWKEKANIEETLKCLCTVVSRLCDTVDNLPEIPEPDETQAHKDHQEAIEELRHDVEMIQSEIGG
jgi:hypothetical protein